MTFLLLIFGFILIEMPIVACLLYTSAMMFDGDYVYVYVKDGTGNWSGISTGFVVQLWSKKIYEAAQGVLVYLIFWTG